MSLSSNSNLSSINCLLVIPRLRVQNANAISGSLTWGFPSITAFAGLTWALQRRLQQSQIDDQNHDQNENENEIDWNQFRFRAIGVICHDHQIQTSSKFNEHFFNLTRNPLGKDGSSESIIEEGRMHLEISLIFGIENDLPELSEEKQKNMAKHIADVLAGMRIAGGSVMPPFFEPHSKSARRLIEPIFKEIGNTGDFERDSLNQESVFREIRRVLLPGFALVSRDDLLAQRWSELQTQSNAQKPNVVDAWLDFSRLIYSCETPEMPEIPESSNDLKNAASLKDAKVSNQTDLFPDLASDKTKKSKKTKKNSDALEIKANWKRQKKLSEHKGWIVPIPVGYGALSPVYPANEITNARDNTTPFRFAECVYSLGEWLSVHRLKNAEELLWYWQNNQTEMQPNQSGIYRCWNDYFRDAHESVS